MLNGDLGVNGFKFQSVITNTIRQRKSVFEVQSPQFSPDTGHSPDRFKKVKGKLMNKIKSSKGLDDFKDLETPEKVKTKKEFRLVVSDDSDDDVELSLSMDLPLNGDAGENEQRCTQKLHDLSSIKQTLSTFLSKNPSFNNLPTLQQSQSQLFQSPAISSKSNRIKPKLVTTATKPTLKRKQVQFLRRLKQNTELSDKVKLDEYIENEELVVEMECKDLLTFMRLQHEIFELSRKQTDFHEKQALHLNLNKHQGDKILEAIHRSNQKSKELREQSIESSKKAGKSLAKMFLMKNLKSSIQTMKSDYQEPESFKQINQEQCQEESKQENLTKSVTIPSRRMPNLKTMIQLHSK